MENKTTSKNLFITGAPGVGKTYHAMEIINDLRAAWDKTRTSAQKFGDELYKVYNCSELMMYARVPNLAIQYYKDAARCSVLLLDDLGVGRKSDFIPDIIYMIVDARLQHNKQTIVTSNLSLSEISELIDDRLASRLSSYEYMKMQGEDRRLVRK